jgi:hypothetical protein
MDQCKGITNDIIPGGCYWLYDNSDASVDTGVCKSKTDNTIECTEVKRSEQCKNNSESTFGSRCVWVEGEETNKCQNTNNCLKQTSSTDCHTFSKTQPDSCLWISTEKEDGYKCQKVYSQCNELMKRETVCNYPEMAKTWNNNIEGWDNIKTCYWLEGNSTAGISALCNEVSVCLFVVDFMFVFNVICFVYFFFIILLVFFFCFYVCVCKVLIIL